jgi:RND family efflux transporter MFP subunit
MNNEFTSTLSIDKCLLRERSRSAEFLLSNRERMMETQPRAAGSLIVELAQSKGAESPALVSGVPTRRGWRRRFAIGAAAVALLALAGSGARLLLQPEEVAVAHPSRGVAIEAVYATGVIEAIDYARFGTAVAGRIAELLVDEGDVVRKGQVVGRLDDRQPRARLEDARARLTMAEQNVARAQSLMSSGFLALQALQRAQQERDQAAAAVDLFARQLEDYTVLSPLSGAVMKRNVEPGETVAANAVLFEVTSTKRKRIAADVDERDIAAVRLGAVVTARADGFPDEAFKAKVTNIRGEGDASSRVFRVEAELPADTKLMIGMTVDVDIVISERLNALLVAASAVGHGPSQGGRPGAPYVFVAERGRARRVDVTTGAVGAAKVEIVAGLNDEDNIVLGAPDRLRDGRSVRIAP